MKHIGKEFKKAISEGGYSQAKVAELVGKGKNTIHRWTLSPNLGLKEIRIVHASIPQLYLKNVFDALEERLGHEIPDNPYRNPERPTPTPKKEARSGIQLMIDANQFAGYRIPSDIMDRVIDILEDAQDDDYGKPSKDGDTDA